METLGPAGRAMFTAGQLEKWMKDEPCDVDSQVYGGAKAYVTREPKGVVGMLVSFFLSSSTIYGLLICWCYESRSLLTSP